MSSTDRCPVCGALTTVGQTVCRRCFEPLQPVAHTPLEAATGDTCTIHRAIHGEALLVFSATLLEYDSSAIAFSTDWNNVAAIACDAGVYALRLHQTPTMLRMSLGSAWLSAQTRTIPLDQFGYPTNQRLLRDLHRFAPQLRR